MDRRRARRPPILGDRWRPARSPRTRERGPHAARRADAARAAPAGARLPRRDLAVAGAGLDLLVAAARDRLSSFSAFSRVEFDGRRAVARGRRRSDTCAGARCGSLVLLTRCRSGASSTGAGCARATCRARRGALLAARAAQVIVGRLTVYSLAIELIGLALAGLADNGQGDRCGLIVLLATTPVTLYADYAIVLDDVGVGGGRAAQPSRVPARGCACRSSSRSRSCCSPELAALAFKNGFTDSTPRAAQLPRRVAARRGAAAVRDRRRAADACTAARRSAKPYPPARRKLPVRRSLRIERAQALDARSRSAPRSSVSVSPFLRAVEDRAAGLRRPAALVRGVVVSSAAA